MFERVVKRVSIIGALALVAAMPARSQLVNGKWQAPAKAGGSAGAAPRQGVQVQRENGGAATAAVANSNGAIPVRVIHAVLMSDGSIVADFGAGLEVVRRACPSSVTNMPLRIVGAAPSSTQPAPGLQPVPGMQPAPSQTTESQRMVPSAQQRAASQAAAQASCHLRDQSGRVFATR